jgi:hypothetical protein
MDKATEATSNRLYDWWLYLGSPIGKLFARLILTVVFFLVVSPIALVLRLAGRDPMHRGFDNAADTYRTASRETPREGLETPF